MMHIDEWENRKIKYVPMTKQAVKCLKINDLSHLITEDSIVAADEITHVMGKTFQCNVIIIEHMAISICKR